MLSGLTFTPGFNLANARILAGCAARAYVTDNIVDAATDTKVLIRECDDCIIIGFQGTKDPVQWVTDADFALVSYGTLYRVHAGFLRSINAVWMQIKAALAVIDAESGAVKPVVLTGHSLGGALAILAAHALVALRPVAMVYTFGQPRVGDGAFCDNYDAALKAVTWRVVNRADIVPDLAPENFGFSHCGQEAFMNAGGALDLNPDRLMVAWTELRELVASAAELQDRLVREHFMGAYLEILFANN